MGRFSEALDHFSTLARCWRNAQKHQYKHPARTLSRFRMNRVEQLEERTLLSIGGAWDEDISLSLVSPGIIGSVADFSTIDIDYARFFEDDDQTVVHAQTQWSDDTGHHVQVQVNSASLAYLPYDDGGLFLIGGAEQLSIPGTPMVPYVPVNVLLPPGMTVTGLNVSAAESVMLDRAYELATTSNPVPLGLGSLESDVAWSDGGEMVGMSNPAAEGSLAELVTVQHVRGYTVAAVNIYPLQLTDEGQCFHSVIDVSIETGPEAVGEWLSPVRNSEGDAALVSAMVANPQDIVSYEGLSSEDFSPLLPPGSYDYVLITSNALTTDFQPLIAQKQSRGVDAVIYTVEDIYTNYTGVDQAEQVREFIKDAYAEWNVEYVLLGGDIDVVPYRGAYASLGGSDIDTMMPTDLYFACLDGSWNSDGDSIWGEFTDGPGGGEVDLMAEVYVGRAPVETSTEVQNFINKTIQYESTAPPNPAHGLWVGEYLWDSGSGPVYGSHSKDPIRNDVMPTEYTYTTLYEEQGTYSKANVIAGLNAEPHPVNHLGHANQYVVMDLYASDVDALANAYPFFTYSQGCWAGAFEYDDCIAENFVIDDHAAFAVVMNSRYGLGSSSGIPAYSHHFDHQFFEAAFSPPVGQDPDPTHFNNHLGGTNQLSKELNISRVETSGSSRPYRWIYFELNLLGDPETPYRQVGMSVASSDPAAGEVIDDQRADFVIDFSDPYDPATVHPADLEVNGIAADTFTQDDADTVTFTFSTSPVTTDGVQTMEIAEGAIERYDDGEPIQAWLANFHYDSLPMEVTFTVPADGSVVTMPFTSLEVNFNEDVDPASIGTDDVILSQGTVIGAAIGGAANVVQYTLDGITQEETLTINMPAGALTDGYGNPMLPYAGSFILDYDTVPYPVPLEPKDPPGSLIYDHSVSGSIGFISDTDSYTIDLGDGQTITIVVDPDATLQPFVELHDPSSILIGSDTAGTPGEDVVIQTIATTGPGTYTVTIGGAGGTTGVYTARVILNAAVEMEEHDGPANDDFSSAQDINDSFITLGSGLAQRGAVLGADAMASPMELFFETFPTQTFDPAKWSMTVNATIDDVGLNEPSAPYAARLNGNPSGGEAIESVVIDLSTEPSAQLSYFYQQTGGGESPDPGEDLVVEFLDAGSNWVELARHLGSDPNMTDFLQDTLTLPPEALHANFQFRFRNTATAGAYDDWFVDDVVLSGFSGTLGGDWYSFTLDDGETATLALAALTPGNMTLALYNGSSPPVPLALGVAAANLDQVINNFVDATSDGTADTYFTQVSGDDADYSLVITRNADFDTEENDDLASAQQLTGTHAALGYLAGPAPEDCGASGTTGGSAETGAAGSDSESHTNAADSAVADARYVPNRLIVRFADSVTDVGKAEVLVTSDATLLSELPLIHGAVIQLPGTEADVLKAAAAWSADPSVVYAEPDYLVHTLETFPNDPTFSNLWGMHNTGQTGGTPDADIDAPEAWDIFTGSSSVVLASIDTGVDYNHVDLAVNMWKNIAEYGGTPGVDDDGNGYVDDIYGIDAYNHDSDPWDDNGHGTHTSGTMGAVGDNGIGVAGVNWDVQIMALKFLSGGGSGATSDAIECVQYMTDMKTTYGVTVVASNNSWGGGGFSQALKDAIEASNDAGIMFVAAAGNDSTDNDVYPHYPSNYDLDGIIAVTATDHNDAQYYNYGATSVDLGAPGRSVHSTIPGDGYASYNGTLMASPHVAGAVGMLMAYNPSATLAEVKAAIMDGTDLIPSLAGITVSEGRLNLAGALALMEPPGDPGDYYQIEVNDGDTLTIGTSTPGTQWPYEFENLLDPAVELYDPSGLLVAADDNSAPDGRNAELTYIAGANGAYTVRVLSSAENGEYVLDLSGNTGGLPAFEVIGSDPAEEERFAAAPPTFTVDFNDTVLLGSLEPLDLVIDGGLDTATGVTPVDGDTVIFDLPVLGEGTHTVTIAAGAILDVQGTPIEEFTSTFVIDLTGPRVTDSSVQEGQIVTISSDGKLVYTADFDEELKDGDLGPEDVAIVGAISGSHVPSLFEYHYDSDPGISDLRLEFDGLPEDDYTLTLYSGDGRFEDLVGNDLDGQPSFPLPSGDGAPGGDFVVNFTFDAIQSGANEFVRLAPLGGLMFGSGDNQGLVNFAGDPDDWTFFTEAGQTAAAVVYPDNPAATLSIELVGLAGAFSASAPGEPAVLPPEQILADGDYSIRVSGDMFCQYELRIGKNLTAEVSDTSDGNELNIDDSFISFGSGRYGVYGTSEPQSVELDSLVWGVQPASGRILLIDPATGDVLHSFAAPDTLSPSDTQIGLSIAQGGDSLIYINSDVDPFSLYRLDPMTGAVLSVESTGGLVYDGLGFETTTVEADTIYSANMDSDPGWMLEGEWAWGVPAGLEGDPSSGNTGDNVVGYNLNGAYPNNMPVYYATTQAIDASMHTGCTLSFYRWLGVESSYYDQATVQVSNDGSNWVAIWENGTEGTNDYSWNLQTYDISAVADGQSTVYVRWSMGTTDGSVTYCGWNIDDVEVTGTLRACETIQHIDFDYCGQECYDFPEPDSSIA